MKWKKFEPSWKTRFKETVLPSVEKSTTVRRDTDIVFETEKNPIEQKLIILKINLLSLIKFIVLL